MQFMFIPLDCFAIYLFLFKQFTLSPLEITSTNLMSVEFDGYINRLHNNIKNIHKFLENNKHNMPQRFTG